MCKLGLLIYIKYIVPWLRKAPGHQQPWYSIFVLVFGHFRFSEFRLYWWIRVLDSVKCPSYLTNYKAFSATETPWVELCLGSVGGKDGIKILNKWRMKMELEQRRQAMLQLHLIDQQFNCLQRCDLYWRLDGMSILTRESMQHEMDY